MQFIVFKADKGMETNRSQDLRFSATLGHSNHPWQPYTHDFGFFQHSFNKPEIAKEVR